MPSTSTAVSEPRSPARPRTTPSAPRRRPCRWTRRRPRVRPRSWRPTGFPTSRCVPTRRRPERSPSPTPRAASTGHCSRASAGSSPTTVATAARWSATTGCRGRRSSVCGSTVPCRTRWSSRTATGAVSTATRASTGRWGRCSSCRGRGRSSAPTGTGTANATPRTSTTLRWRPLPTCAPGPMTCRPRTARQPPSAGTTTPASTCAWFSISPRPTAAAPTRPSSRSGRTRTRCRYSRPRPLHRPLRPPSSA